MKDDPKPHEETVAPFFLARHELTQAQWLRLRPGKNPSRYKSGFKSPELKAPITLVHPVEDADWTTCDGLVREFGLLLPRPAQWEYACRAGTDTPWYSGRDPEDLRRVANVLDKSARLAGWQGDFEEWEDGFILHAPVGSFTPNRFGLFDMHGNVWEWCSDFGPIQASATQKRAVTHRAFRGGSFYYEAKWARSATRIQHAAAFRASYLGVRVARAVQTAR